MATKQSLYPLQTYRYNDLRITGLFQPNGAGVPNVINGDRAGGIWSVARTGTGLFVITFVEAFFLGNHADANLWNPSISTNCVSVVSFDPTAANRKLTIQVQTAAGVAQDVGPTAGLYVAFDVQVQDGYQK